MQILSKFLKPPSYLSILDFRLSRCIHQSLNFLMHSCFARKLVELRLKIFWNCTPLCRVGLVFDAPHAKYAWPGTRFPCIKVEISRMILFDVSHFDHLEIQRKNCDMFSRYNLFSFILCIVCRRERGDGQCRGDTRQEGLQRPWPPLGQLSHDVRPRRACVPITVWSSNIQRLAWHHVQCHRLKRRKFCMCGTIRQYRTMFLIEEQ